MRHAHLPLPGAVALLVLTVASGCTKGSEPSSPTSPSPPGPGQNVSYTALGASDAVAIGASASCVPLVPCPDGTGYVQLIARTLSAGRAVTLMNLGIPAAVLSPEIQAIGASYGRTIPGNFLEREMPFVPRDSTLVTIFAGGNDTNTIGTAVEGGAGGDDPVGYIDTQVRGFGRDYTRLIEGIRSRAPSARIVVANLPNMGALPYAFSYPHRTRQGLQRISVGFSAETNRLAGLGVAVVDLMCDPRSYEPGYYSSDGFHPNDAGYRFIADLLLEAINATGYPAPRSSCPQMSVIP